MYWKGLVSIIVIAVIVVVVGFFVFEKFFPPTTITAPVLTSQAPVSLNRDLSKLKFTPVQAVEKAEAFIIENVGKEYFHAYYKFDMDKTEKRNENGVTRLVVSGSPYHISYIYKALREIGGGDTEVIVDIDRNNSVGGGLGIFDCVKKPLLCQFKVTKEEVIALALREGFNVSSKDFQVLTAESNEKASTGEGWTWLVSETILYPNGECHIRDLDINMSTKKIFGPFENNCPQS